MTKVKTKRVIYVTVLVLLQVALIVFFLSDILPEGGVPFDDAWIHFVFARNIAEHGELSFNPNRWSGGTTSLLWDVLLAIGYRLSGNMLATAYGLGTAFYVLGSVLFYFLLEKIYEDQLEGQEVALAASVGLAVLCYIPYLALSGMDTLLFLALSIGSLTLFVYGKHHWVKWLLAALILTRIEGIILTVLLIIAYTLQKQNSQQYKRRITIALPPFFALVLYLLFNKLVTGSYLPTTMAGRRWLWGLPEELWALDSQRTLRFFRDWWYIIKYFIISDNGFFHTLFLILIPLGVLGLLINYIRQPMRSLGLVLFTTWVLLHNLLYLALAPIASWRHQVPNLVLLPVLAINGWLFGIRMLQVRFRILVTALGGLILLLCLLPRTILYQQIYTKNVEHINHVHAAAGKWISEHLPENAVVAAFDIGAIRYFGNRQTLDLGGLIDINFVHRYLYPRRVEKYLCENDATHLAIPEPVGGQTDLKQRLGLLNSERKECSIRLRPLIAFQVEPYILPPFTLLQYQFYTAYLKVVVYEIERP